MEKFILGVSGYIGAGKSTAAEFFSELGASVIDADEVVDVLYQPGAEGYRKILDFFGEEYFKKDGSINRKKLAKVVFDDPNKLRILHSLIHPLVTAYIHKIIDKSKETFIVLEAIYFEKKHLEALVSALVWIESEKEQLFERVKNRGIDRALFEKIYRLQVKPAKIDYIIKNDGSLKDLEKEVSKLWKILQKKLA